MEIKQGESLYHLMLRAGAIRKRALRLHSEAETIENLARMKFEDEGGSAVAIPQTPGMVLVLAYNGPANGRVTRVPYDKLNQLSLIGPAPEGSVAMSHEYEPAIIVRLHNFVVGSLAVRKGQVDTLYEELREERDEEAHGPKPAALAIARMLTLSIGFNPEMVTDLLRSIEGGARIGEGSSNVAMFLQVGVPQ